MNDVHPSQKRARYGLDGMDFTTLTVIPEDNDHFATVLSRANRLRSGDESTATMIVGGSVHAFGGRIGIAARLTDVATGCYVCSESRDATLSDMFGAHEQVAELMARPLAER